jgi:plasmid stability protein
MPEKLSIENAPDHVVDRLRQRAKLHRRSLQGELLAIIETAVLDVQFSVLGGQPGEIARTSRRSR